jgi:hypothetical protein
VTQASKGRVLRWAALSRALRRAAMDRALEQAAMQRALRRASVRGDSAAGVPDSEWPSRGTPCR